MWFLLGGKETSDKTCQCKFANVYSRQPKIKIVLWQIMVGSEDCSFFDAEARLIVPTTSKVWAKGDFPRLFHPFPKKRACSQANIICVSLTTTSNVLKDCSNLTI